MVIDLAQKIYGDAIRLKRYDSAKMRWFWHRMALKKDLHRMQAQVDALTEQLRQEKSCAPSDEELARYMSQILEACIQQLDSGDRSRYERVRRMVWGFHNLPRAFFPVTDRMKISAETEMEYFAPYAK